MTHLSGTFHRPTHVAPAALAGMLVTGLIVAVVALVGLGVGVRTGEVPGAAVAPVTVPGTDRAAIVGQLQSEYLRSIAAGWYVAAVPAQRTDRAAIVGQLQSEYLRSIAAGWHVPAQRTDRAAILGQLQSGYLQEIAVAGGWYVEDSTVNPNQLFSEYLREIARDW